MATVAVSNQVAPEWRVLAEQEHLVVARQFTRGGTGYLTLCNRIGVPSAYDKAMRDAPRCRICADLGEDAARIRQFASRYS
ncbi:hypothetical protein [Amycolatopsis dongchuanensis]|uniref:hypothetical protein n=1 Tax=Amycolatopsis dongchuanensis TaxID=1070866 RepID=UPI0031FA1023